MTELFKPPASLSKFRSLLGVLGTMVASAFFVWFLAGWFEWVPSLVEVFGIEGLRIPATITIGALLMAAVAFWEF